MVLFISLLIFMNSCGNKEKKAVRNLVQEITSQAQEAEAVGRILQGISVLEQAQNLDSTAQCKAARDIYCALYTMVKENCIDQVSFCQTIADALYGGSFPVGGMNICTSIASDKCSELAGFKQELQQLCLELRRRCN